MLKSNLAELFLYACEADILKEVMKHINEFNINKKDNNNQTLLEIACKIDKKEIVELLINKKADINIKCENNKSYLHLACSVGNLDMVKLFIKKGIFVDIIDDEHKTPLMYACISNKIKVVSFLIENNANINAIDIYNNIPIYIAAEKNYNNIVKLLIEKNAEYDIEKLNILQNSAVVDNLYFACQEGFMDYVVKHITEENIDKKDDNDNTLLKLACLNNHLNIAKFLIEKNANIGIKFKYNESYLHLACEANNLNMVKLFIEQGISVNILDKDKITPLVCACVQNNYEIASYLIKNGADVNIGNSFLTPIYYASSKNYIKIAKLLIDNGAKTIVKLPGQELSFLFYICYSSKTNTSTEMLEIMSKAVDFDINFKNFYGESALHRAVLGNSLESVKFLIEHGADINSVNSKDETPLNYAIRNADVLTWNKELNIPFIVEYLIKQGADLYRDNIDGINAIYIAAMVESLKMTKYLHEVCGMPINLPDKANLHCIHYAAMGENLKLIKYLIEKGVDINTLTGQRENALHLATGSQNNEIAEFLIKNGINYEQLNIKKETAIHIAYKTNNIFVFNLIMNDKLEKDKKARKKIMKSNLRNYYNAKTNKFNFY